MSDLKDCKCLDKEDKDLLIQAIDDAVGFNAYRIRVEKRTGKLFEVDRLTKRKLTFNGLMDTIKNVPECK